MILLSRGRLQFDRLKNMHSFQKKLLQITKRKFLLAIGPLGAFQLTIISGTHLEMIVRHRLLLAYQPLTLFGTSRRFLIDFFPHLYTVICYFTVCYLPFVSLLIATTDKECGGRHDGIGSGRSWTALDYF